MELQLRPATMADLATLTAFMQEMYHTDATRHALPPEAPRRTLTLSLDAGNSVRVWMLAEEAAGSPIGYGITAQAFTNEYGPTLYLDELYFAETARSKGYGRQYLHFMEDYARSLGFHTLQLFVSPANRAAARLYEREGYRLEPYEQMLKLI